MDDRRKIIGARAACHAADVNIRIFTLAISHGEYSHAPQVVGQGQGAARHYETNDIAALIVFGWAIRAGLRPAHAAKVSSYALEFATMLAAEQRSGLEMGLDLRDSGPEPANFLAPGPVVLRVDVALAVQRATACVSIQAVTVEGAP